MASSIASLANAGFMAALEPLGCVAVLGLSWNCTGGGGGGGAITGTGGGGGGVKTGVEGERGGEEGGSALLSSSEAFLNLSSSSAASDWVWRTQRSKNNGESGRKHKQGPAALSSLSLNSLFCFFKFRGFNLNYF